MEETYELNTQDVLLVLEHQLATTDFNGQSNYTPYQEFNPEGDCVYANLMSCYISFSLSSSYRLSRRSDSAPDATSFLTDYSSTCYIFRIYTYFQFQVFF